MQKSLSITLAVLFLISMRALAAEPQQQVVLWPNAEHPVLRFTFSRFKDLGGSVGSQRPFVTDTTVENLSDKLISSERFTLYVFDRKQIRIGEAWMAVSNLGPGQAVKFQTSMMVSGTPFTVQVVALSATQKAITLTVNSVPQGALLKVDDVEAGTTPRLISIGPGKHRLSFSKDGTARWLRAERRSELSGGDGRGGARGGRASAHRPEQSETDSAGGARSAGAVESAAG
jgi:hypothetical protein